MLLNIFRKLYQLAWIFAVVILVLLALYASLGRYYIGFVENYQALIVNELEQRSGFDIELAGLKGSWSGLSPVLSLKGVALSSDGVKALSLGDAEVRVNLLASLLLRQPSISELRIRDLALGFYQDEDGVWHFGGLALRGAEQDAGQLGKIIDGLLSIREADIVNMRVELRYADDSESLFWADASALRSDGHFRRLYLELGIDASETTRILMEGYGDPRRSSFTADAYIKLAESRFDTLGPLFGDLASLADGKSSGEMWFRWRAGTALSVSGELSIPRLAVGTIWQQPEQNLGDLQLQFGGRYQAGLWKLWFPVFQATWQDEPIVLDGSYVEQTSREPALLRVGLPELDVGHALGVVDQLGDVSSTLKSVLKTLDPSGTLGRPNILLPLSPDEMEHLRVEAELRDVTVSPWRGAPGIAGANGHVVASARSGRVLLDSDDIALMFAGIYPEPLQLDSLRAEVGWEIDDERVRVDSGPIAATDGDAKLTALLGLDIPLREELGNPEMMLSVGIVDGDASLHEKYVPLVVADGLRDWLRQSIRAGKVREGGFIHRGALVTDRPEQRTVQLFFDIEDGEIAYHPDWPAVRNADASVVIDNGVVTVSATDLRLLDDAQAERVKVVVHDSGGGLELDIEGQLRAPVNDALQVLRDSPIRDWVGATFDKWQARGEVEAQLQLNIPLAGQQRQPRVVVSSEIDATELSLGALGLQIDDVKGPLYYNSDDGLSSVGISGVFQEQPLQAVVRQSANQPLRISVDGRIDDTGLRNWLQQPVLDFMVGETDYSVEITVGSGGALLYAYSTLVGMEIDVPEPLYKSASDSRQFRLSLPLSERPPSLEFSIAGIGRMAMQFAEDGGFEGGRITVGTSAAGEPDSGHLTLAGSLDFLNLAQWQGIADRYLAAASRYAAEGAGAGAMPIRIENFKIQTGSLFGLDITDVTINGHNGEDGRDAWELQLQSEQLQGALSLPEQRRGEPFRAVLERLTFPRLDLGALIEDGQPLLADVDPRTLFDMNIDVQQLIIEEENWGSIGFDVRRLEAGAGFENLRGELRGIRFGEPEHPLSVSWLRDGSGDRTEVQGRVAMRNLGDVMERWHYERLMEGKYGYYDLDVSWGGAPEQFAPELLAGSLYLRLEDGRFLRIPETASDTLRVVGVFNLANLLRRLQLDFRDVLSRGIHYDVVSGRVVFEEGVMTLDQSLLVTAPSSRIRVSGAVDFIEDDTDMELVATLPIGTNLPWVAALAGGLPAALGAFVVSKIFEEQVDRFSSAVYRISGPWREPEIRFSRIFDEDNVRIRSKNVDGLPDSMPELSEEARQMGGF